MDLAGRAEVVGAREQVGNRRALPRLPLRSGYYAALRRRTEVTAQERMAYVQSVDPFAKDAQ